jgi:hypothetical protein
MKLMVDGLLRNGNGGSELNVQWFGESSVRNWKLNLSQ